MKDRILFAGMNKYPGCPLRGCVNDTINMHKELVDAYGVTPDNADIKTLLDGDATTANYKDALRWLADAPAGVRKFYHNSGHGAQVESDLETDGYLEVICPIDFDWSPEKMITDKDFVEIFSKSAQGSPFTWLSDSCHSGDLDRGMARLGGPVNCSKAYPGKPAHMKKINPMMNRTLRSEIAAKFDVGFVSGCRSDQTSADTVINGQPCGALTSYLLRALRDNMRSAPLTELAAHTAKLLAVDDYDQEPGADGTRAGLPFWG